MLKRWASLAYYEVVGTAQQSKKGGQKRRSSKGSRRKVFFRPGDFNRGGNWRDRKGLAAFLILGGFTAVVMLAAVFGEQGMLKVRHLNGERAALAEQIDALAAETALLRHQVRGMQNDPFLYEKAARERLGLVKPGEVVYDFRADPLERAP